MEIGGIYGAGFYWSMLGLHVDQKVLCPWVVVLCIFALRCAKNWRSAMVMNNVNEGLSKDVKSQKQTIDRR